MRTLIIKTGAAGDVLRTTFVPMGLKKKNPQAQIDWEVNKKYFPLLENNPALNKIYTSGVFYQDYDEIICLDDKLNYPEYLSEWFDMSLVSRLGKNKADYLKKQNIRTYQQIIANALKIEPKPPILILNENNYEFANNFAVSSNISLREPIIGLNTGAGNRWQQKKWSIKKTVQLAKKLKKDYQVILFGGLEEKKRNQKILNQVDIINSGYYNSLLDFAALINLCDLLVTVDTFALHIATAFGIKIVALFGPTSAAEIDLFGKGEKIITPMKCACCYKKNCNKKPNCMDKIEVNRVYQSIKKLL